MSKEGLGEAGNKWWGTSTCTCTWMSKGWRQVSSQVCKCQAVFRK